MEVQEKILEKAIELFKRYGIRSVTMDDLANHCAVSKKTLYQHFNDKDTLVETMIVHMIDHAECRCQQDKQKAQNAVHEIFLSMDMLTQMFEGVNAALMFDLRKYHPQAFKRVDTHKREFLTEIVRGNLERGIQEGLFRPEINVDIITQLHMVTISIAFFEQMMFTSAKYSVLEVNLEIMTHYLYGLVTPKGAKLIERYKLQRQQKPTTI
ncbi:MAG TPA: TetR/AcrR family transcriptional regulator [Phnomibacter sp.]|nr:TetR/AcrR family transcriptional regulator [Phnomibacter sp.]